MTEGWFLANYGKLLFCSTRCRGGPNVETQEGLQQALQGASPFVRQQASLQDAAGVFHVPQFG